MKCQWIHCSLPVESKSTGTFDNWHVFVELQIILKKRIRIAYLFCLGLKSNAVLKWNVNCSILSEHCCLFLSISWKWLKNLISLECYYSVAQALGSISYLENIYFSLLSTFVLKEKKNCLKVKALIVLNLMECFIMFIGHFLLQYVSRNTSLNLSSELYISSSFT